MNGPDIGSDLPDYPAGAGFRDDEASRDGARKVNRDGSRVTQCAFVLVAIMAAGPKGICAYRIYNAPDAPFRDLSTCRARISDLLKQGKIAKKGERVDGEAGVKVNLWIAAEYAPPADRDEQPDMFVERAPAPRATLSLTKPLIPAHLIARYASGAA